MGGAAEGKRWGPRAGRWAARAAVGGFAALLLYPWTGLLAPVGPWQWDPGLAAAAGSAVRTSLVLTGAALAGVVALGTPAALYVARCGRAERLCWQALFLVSVLLPPLALGLLLSLSYGPLGPLGAALQRLGLQTTNSRFAFVLTQAYVGAGYYVLSAAASFSAVPRRLEQQAALLGAGPWRVFWRVTFPLARVGLAAGLGLAWVRTVGEFGAVVITAYYPAGLPVQLWVNLQSSGLPAVMPLLVAFVLAALPLPWLGQVLAQRAGDREDPGADGS